MTLSKIGKTTICGSINRDAAEAESDTEQWEPDALTNQESADNGKLVVLCDDDEEDSPSITEFDPKRPHSCRICAKTFIWKQAMKRHVANHSGKKPWRCSECNKRFSRKEHAVRHQALLHSNNPKPWLCPVCKRNFSLKGNAKSHIKNVHGFELANIPKIEMPKMAVIGTEADHDEATPISLSSPKTINKQVQPSPAVDPVLGNSKPKNKNNTNRNQQVRRGKTDAVSGVNQKKRKRSPSSDHDSGYESLTNKSPRNEDDSFRGKIDELDDDIRDFKFKFDYESPVVAEVE